jgi:hypothetical protein
MGSVGRKLTKSNAEEIAKWCGGKVAETKDALDPEGSDPILGVNVPCKGEVKRAMPGNTIVCKSNGTFNVYR